MVSPYVLVTCQFSTIFDAFYEPVAFVFPDARVQTPLSIFECHVSIKVGEFVIYS